MAANGGSGDVRAVTIVGAGLVGCLWAILLRQRGLQVTVYEKRGDLRLAAEAAGRSINLIVTSRGLHALTQAGLNERVLELAVPVFGRMMHAKNGETQYQPYGQAGEKNLSVSRRDLNVFLLNEAERAGAVVHFDHTVEAVDFRAKTLSFADGAHVQYELLFATDGAGSAVRKNLLAQFPTEYREKSEWLTADYKELFLPAPNPLDRQALHIWPRGTHMMMALGNLDGSFTVTLYLPKRGPLSFEGIRGRDDIVRLFQNEFPDAIPLMPEYVRDFETHPTGALGTVRTSKWIYENSAALLGDAAHAIVPFFGQGMNAGFEDCTTCLRLLDENSGDWSATLAAYDQTQRPNANAIADMAIENWHEMSERVADPKFLLRKKIEAELERAFPHLYKSRYGMVTYTLIPYHVVQKAGALQEELFAELLREISSPEDLSLRKAESLLDQRYRPFLREHGLL
jgi:kynurenine 3-monooxygenase